MERRSMPVKMKIKGLMIDPVSNMPIIVLKDPEGDSVLPIWVGIFEANAIAMQLEKIESPRPMTHDLLRSVIEALKARVDRVVITDLKDNTFFALIYLQRNGESMAIDARPSDAMALALRADVPILVEETVLHRSSVTSEEQPSDETERLRRWLETVDPEELGKYEM
jgi:bifunctional DNase/RNase